MVDKKVNSLTTPVGELALRTLAMPKDTNPSGDIFGGWLLSQMDIAGGIECLNVRRSRFTTVAVTNMRFWNPVKVGDIVCVHCKINKVGRTSVTIGINAWRREQLKNEEERELVAEAEYVYVLIDDEGKPVQIEEEDKQRVLQLLKN